jgi:branched-chain amino acid transport system substrate-binding protein
MGTIPDAAMESTPVSHARKIVAIVLLAALAWAVAPVAEAQPPIRIGASIAQTGLGAAPGPNQLRGYQLCAKHMNDKVGVLGRKLELVVYDDASDPATAARLYEKLIAQDKVDLVLGPFGSASTEAAASVTEKHRMPMVAPTAADTSIYRKGRKFIFSMQPPAEVVLEGLIDLSAKKGLKTVALLNADISFGRAATKGTTELAKKKGLQVVFVDAYPRETTDFSTILIKVREANPDVLVVATGGFEDLVAITRQMKALNANPKMTGLTVGVELPKFYEVLGRDAEFVYGVTSWLPELVALRAGGLIPIARQYPGAREFVESYKKEFPGADLSQLSAVGYGGCQILVEAIRRAGSLDGEKLRDAISKMDHNTVFGAFRVDRNGVQTAHKFLLFQWQDGKKAIVWPEELAPDKPRFPTPPWSQRP